MPGWNFADIYRVVAQEIPLATALIHGQRRLTWAEVDQRSDHVARYLAAAGLSRQDKVAQYLYNAPE